MMDLAFTVAPRAGEDGKKKIDLSDNRTNMGRERKYEREKKMRE